MLDCTLNLFKIENSTLKYLNILSHLNELGTKQNEYVNKWSTIIKTDSLKTVKIYLKIEYCKKYSKHLNKYISNYWLVYKKLI